MKIAIIVKGGNVQSAYASEEDVTVDVYDIDNYSDPDECEETYGTGNDDIDVVIENAVKDMYPVY